MNREETIQIIAYKLAEENNDELCQVIKEIDDVQSTVAEYMGHVHYANVLMMLNTGNFVVGMFVLLLTTIVGCNLLIEHSEWVRYVQYTVIAEIAVFLIIPGYTMLQWGIGKIWERILK